MRARLKRLILGGVLVSCLTLACADEEEDATPKPAAPQITEGADDPALRRSLLSLSEIAAAPAAPRGLVEQPVSESGLFENAGEAVATHSRIILRNQPALYAGAVLLRNGGRVSILVTFSEDPVPPRFIQAVAVTAAEKL